MITMDITQKGPLTADGRVIDAKNTCGPDSLPIAPAFIVNNDSINESNPYAPDFLVINDSINKSNPYDVQQVPLYKKTGFKLGMMMVVAVVVAVILALVFLVFADDSSDHPVDPTLVTKAEVLTSYINNITLSRQTITSNGTSAERMALAWLIFNDTTLDTSAWASLDAPLAENSIGFSIRQRFPLLVMWFQQTETAKWTSTTGWLVDPSECNWYGITCEAMYVDYNDDSDGGTQNVVTKISFNLVSSYVGVIPSDIGLLSHLKHFEMINTRDTNDRSGSFLKGSLPESIGRLTALTYFNAIGNALTGMVPESLGQWLYNNSLNGPLPSSIGHWTALTSFSVGNNTFSGPLPDSISPWTALVHFDVSDNDLTGMLPDYIGQWSSLTYFNVGRNSLFRGSLPDNVGQLTALTFFAADNNYFSGTLPENFGKLTALNYFDIRYNFFNSTIPMSIGNWSLIQHAYFDENNFIGTMPNAICQYIDPGFDELQADCLSEIQCTCCTDCY